MIICVDLDGVLTKETEGWAPNVYKLREPNIERIEILKRLVERGHKIIIHTARLSSEARVETIEWLTKHRVPYDAIHFDKPFYDYYIDDKMATLEDLGKVVDK